MGGRREGGREGGVEKKVSVSKRGRKTETDQSFKTPRSHYRVEELAGLLKVHTFV